MRLVLDHHVTSSVALLLRERGYDVVTAHERSWHRASDEDLLSAAAAEGRAVVTANIRDFVPLARAWVAEGRRHAGVILVPEPRLLSALGTGRLVEALAALIDGNPEEAPESAVHWL